MVWRELLPDAVGQKFIGSFRGRLGVEQKSQAGECCGQDKAELVHRVSA